MSFRELRTLTETMQSLGYPRLISRENFRTPNFELVADVLHWLVTRYDPSCQLALAIGTAQERVQFLKAATAIMATRARIRLQAKRLYAADGYAVRELLKIALVLDEAMRLQKRKAAAGEKDEGHHQRNDNRIGASSPALDGPMQHHSVDDVTPASKVEDVKKIRALASTITDRCAVLYDALEREPALRESRRAALSSHVQLEDVEAQVKSAISSGEKEASRKEKDVNDLEGDLANLRVKIEKKQAELDRNQKRLVSLQGVRPHFMDEYEKLEGELGKLFTEYLARFRNLEYLEHELDRHNSQEQSKVEESKRMLNELREKIKRDEKRLMLDGDEEDEDLFVIGDGGGGGGFDSSSDDDIDAFTRGKFAPGGGPGGADNGPGANGALNLNINGLGLRPGGGGDPSGGSLGPSGRHRPPPRTNGMRSIGQMNPDIDSDGSGDGSLLDDSDSGDISLGSHDDDNGGIRGGNIGGGMGGDFDDDLDDLGSGGESLGDDDSDSGF